MSRKKKINTVAILLIVLFLTTAFILAQFWRLLRQAQQHNADEIELVTLSHNILHANDSLIKYLKIYVLNKDEKYRNSYLDLLNDYNSFFGRLDRMKEIGLSESELQKTDQIMEIWSQLEKIEASALEALDNFDYETAEKIVYSEIYTQTDYELSKCIMELTEEIELRGQTVGDNLENQIRIILYIFSVAFIVILAAVAFIFAHNNKLKDLYIKEQEAALIAAEQSSRYKSSFLATMSHEIRTPMNAILGISEIQLRSDSLSIETEEAFGKIYESGNLLLHIINDILDLSKIEAGKLEIFPVEYDIPSLINDAVQITRLRYESKPIDFQLNLDEKIPLDLFGDELRIKQILYNILSNAFKYTDEGEVNFSVRHEELKEKIEDNDIMVIFRIADTGQGMSKDQVSKLFDEYSRFNMEANRTTVGTGLGMSIARRLINLMNGKIFVQSELGEGSVFTVHIPQKRISDKVCGANLASKLQNFNFKSTLLLKKSNIIREYMPYGRVLIVDDVESNLYVAKGMLTVYGLTIETAISGFESIDKIKEGNKYDIIFMDHMMPKMDGIEAVKQIRELGYTGYIVALTANAIVGQAGVFLKNGFDGYISKPIDSRELNFVLNDLIRDKKPPEVVEQARKEQKLKELDKTAPISEIKRMFVLDAERAIGELRYVNGKILGKKPLTEEDIQNYIITVHGMKTALANIDEAVLSETALTLEKAGHNKDFALLEKQTGDFINALQEIAIKYKPEEKELKGTISLADLAYLKEKMKAIRAACEIFNKKVAKDTLAEVKQKPWPKQIKHFLDDIGLFILHSDFDKAVILAESTGIQAEAFCHQF